MPLHTGSSSHVKSPGQKLRRKAPSDSLFSQTTTSAQRLVDYFVVVSSRPRWESAGEKKKEKSTTSQRKQQKGEGRFGRIRRRFSKEEISLEETRQGSDGSDETTTEGNIHMPQHRQQQDHCFQPEITARYPLVDYEDNPLNPMILQFCYPSGDVIYPSRSYHLPQVHHFVLTNDRGRKVYGTCLTVYEEFIPQGPWRVQALAVPSDDGSVELSYDNRGKALYIPKVLCILSSWPYLTAFREYLAQLYRLATATNVMDAPIERYVVNLVHEIPAPPPGAYEVQVSILNSTIRFWAPPAKLPVAYVALPYKILFECLDFENILTVWSAMIVERKILLLSSQYSILTVCSEILCSLLFPMRWSHLYVPLLPKMLCPMLDAPVPFLVGVVRQTWHYAQQFVSSDTIVVDLDRNSVQVHPGVPPIPHPPTKKWNKLHGILSELVGDIFWKVHGMEQEYKALLMARSSKSNKRSNIQRLRQAKKGSSQWNERLGGLDNAFNLAFTPDSKNLLNDTLSEDEQQKWARVQEAFHQFFVGTLKDYQKFLSIPQPSGSHNKPVGKPAFDRVSFLARQKTESVPFMKEMLTTQQFDDFLTRRMYSPGEPDLVFFDQSIEAKKNRSKLKFRKVETPFLQGASAHKDLTKFPAIPPDNTGLSDFEYDRVLRPFIYKKWPDAFEEDYFSSPRPIPRMITAEFDRQALLVSKLHLLRDIDEDSGDGDDDIMEFYGGDYDSSPEVAAFTVFFFVYSALVGCDWQAYKQKRQLEEQRRQKSGLPSIGRADSSRTESREGVEGTADSATTMLRPNGMSKSATDDCISDLSLGICDACPDIGLYSTLVSIQHGAEESFDCFFQKTVEEMHERNAEDQQMLMSSPENYQAIAQYEEARAVASAQLDLAFETLETLALRRLSADSDSYLSIMEACGRCGDTHYAVKLMELMKNDGFVADSEVLGSFIAAFASHDEEEGIEVDSTSNHSGDSFQESGTDAYSRFLEKQYDAVKYQGFGGAVLSTLKSSLALQKEASAACSDLIGSEDDDSAASSGGFMDWFSSRRPQQHLNHNGKRHRRRKSASGESSSSAELPVTEMLERQIGLGETLFDFIYPELHIDTNSDSCPHCSFVLSENDVVAGWTGCAFSDYTTQCPKCKHRFVPQFVVTTSAPDFEGSQGVQTPLYCEFLSPWVVRKEMHAVIKGETGIDGMLRPEWRQGTEISSTLFWNLMVLFRRYKLPFAFLLQGNFHNRLILPPKPDET